MRDEASVRDEAPVDVAVARSRDAPTDVMRDVREVGRGLGRRRTVVGDVLAAAPAFEVLIPGLHSGDAAHAWAAPSPPYPVARRPQHWSAAAVRCLEILAR